MKKLQRITVWLLCLSMLALASCNAKDTSSIRPSSLESTAEEPSSMANEPAEGDVNEPKDFDILSNKNITWGPGKTVDGIRPSEPSGLQQKYGQYNAAFIGEDVKKVYLTFDEGYENGFSPKILDTLKEKQVSAVFFVTYDFVQKEPELVQRMIDEGHVVGNHTKKHPVMPDVSTERCQEEIQFLHDYVKENFHYEMTLFRPPTGAFSERTLAITQSLGYQSVFWSFAYSDWDVKKQMEPAKALEKITSSAHNGCIYLLHAVSETNAQILGQVIDKLRDNGFEVSKYDVKPVA